MGILNGDPEWGEWGSWMGRTGTLNGEDMDI